MLKATSYQPSVDLEQHVSAMGALVRLANYREVPVGELEQRRYIGDFYGLLKHLRVDSKYWAYNLQVNRLAHAGEYNGAAIIKISESNLIDIFLQRQTVLS